MRQFWVVAMTCAGLFAPALAVGTPAEATAATCATGGQCTVGDTGPGGGIVFFVRTGTDQVISATWPDTSSDCQDYMRFGYWDSYDWSTDPPTYVMNDTDPCVTQSRSVTITAAEQAALDFDYLEAAPASSEPSSDLPFDGAAVDSNDGYVAGASSDALGTGASNTAAVVAARPSDSESNNAAIFADSLTAGGVTDWFLPSKRELTILAMRWGQTPAEWDDSTWSYVRPSNPFGDFSTDQEYWASGGWSSTQNPPRPWGFDFLSGEPQAPFFWSAKNVRAVRAFSATPSLAPETQTITAEVGSVMTPSSSLVPANFSSTPTYTVTSGTLPAGLSLDSSTGVISGTPSAAGTTSLTITGSRGSQSATVTVTLEISAAPANDPPPSSSEPAGPGTPAPSGPGSSGPGSSAPSATGEEQQGTAPTSAGSNLTSTPGDSTPSGPSSSSSGVSAGMPPAAPLAVIPTSRIPGLGRSITTVDGRLATCTTSTSRVGTTTACGSLAIIDPCSTDDDRADEGGRERPLGLYVHLREGATRLSAVARSLSITGEQTGYLPRAKATPVRLPTDPRITFLTTVNPPSSVDPSANPHSPQRQCTGQQSSAPRSLDIPGKGRRGVDAVPGDAVTLQIGGFMPNAPVSIYLGSGAQPLGTLRTDRNGTLAGWVRVPSTSARGSTTLQVAGQLTGGTPVSVTTGIRVRRP